MITGFTKWNGMAYVAERLRLEGDPPYGADAWLKLAGQARRMAENLTAAAEGALDLAESAERIAARMITEDAP